METFHGTDCSEETFREFREWLAPRMPVVFVSDNPAYDFQWINFYFWRYFGENPFGHSGRRIADFYAGLDRGLQKHPEMEAAATDEARSPSRARRARKCRGADSDLRRRALKDRPVPRSHRQVVAAPHRRREALQDRAWPLLSPGNKYADPQAHNTRCTSDRRCNYAAMLRPFLPAKYSPLQESGDGLQSVYLAELPPALADALNRPRVRRGLPHVLQQQELVIVPEVRDKLLDAWGIDAGVRVGELTREQSAYLEYHRANVFKRSLLEP